MSVWCQGRCNTYPGKGNAVAACANCCGRTAAAAASAAAL